MRSRTPSKRIPQTIEETDEAVRQIALLRREIADEGIGLEEQIAQLRAWYVDFCEPRKAEIKQLSESVQSFAEARRGELLTGTRKYFTLPSGGVLRWRMTPPKLVISISEAELIKAFKRRNLLGFIRVKEEVDKEAVKKNFARLQRIKGVALDQHEDFIIETQ